MNIADFLSSDDVLIERRALDKARLLKELAGRAAAKVHLGRGQIADGLLKREKLGSTGMGGGVAIPHARFGELTKPFGLLARLETPIEFDAVDGLPVDVVFLLLAPAGREGDQLNALACIARQLRNADALARLRSATDSAGIYQAATAVV
jgi:PTS system nitrogen regulatory IIA component